MSQPEGVQEGFTSKGVRDLVQALHDNKRTRRVTAAKQLEAIGNATKLRDQFIHRLAAELEEQKAIGALVSLFSDGADVSLSAISIFAWALSEHGVRNAVQQQYPEVPGTIMRLTEKQTAPIRMLADLWKADLRQAALYVICNASVDDVLARDIARHHGVRYVVQALRTPNVALATLSLAAAAIANLTCYSYNRAKAAASEGAVPALAKLAKADCADAQFSAALALFKILAQIKPSQLPARQVDMALDAVLQLLIHGRHDEPKEPAVLVLNFLVGYEPAKCGLAALEAGVLLPLAQLLVKHPWHSDTAITGMLVLGNLLHLATAQQVTVLRELALDLVVVAGGMVRTKSSLVMARSMVVLAKLAADDATTAMAASFAVPLYTQQLCATKDLVKRAVLLEGLAHILRHAPDQVQRVQQAVDAGAVGAVVEQLASGGGQAMGAAEALHLINNITLALDEQRLSEVLAPAAAALIKFLGSDPVPQVMRGLVVLGNMAIRQPVLMEVAGSYAAVCGVIEVWQVKGERCEVEAAQRLLDVLGGVAGAAGPPPQPQLCLLRFTPVLGDQSKVVAQAMARALKEKQVEQAAALKTCAACGAGSKRGGSLSQCSRCGKVAYCSKECQKAHWKVHKPGCCCYC